MPTFLAILHHPCRGWSLLADIWIKNIVDATIQRFGKVPTLVGGIHLSAVDDKRISSTLDYLREKGITPFLCHCSGEKAEKECERIGVGDTLFFV